MIHSERFTSVLDTNVIYPVVLRDVLFWFAYEGLYRPKWSRDIFVEWERVMKRKGMPTIVIDRQIAVAHEAFPDAMVANYEN